MLLFASLAEISGFYYTVTDNWSVFFAELAVYNMSVFLSRWKIRHY